MNTNWQLATAAVTGARHLRVARNGQDAASAWLGEQAAAIVVCDGCGSGAGSELGARLGAQLVLGTLARELGRGAPAGDEAMWRAVRAETASAIGELLARVAGDREDALRDAFLFTIVAAAVTRDEAAVWALGDGAYTLGREARVLGPFAGNAPPYLAYDLLGAPRACALHVAPASCGSVVIATDGVVDLIGEGEDGAPILSAFAAPGLARPDALRRHLALLARSGERVDWEARRVVRTPARLQDDCAVAALRWELPS